MIKPSPPSPANVLAKIISLGLDLEKMESGAVEELVNGLSNLLQISENEISVLLSLFRSAFRDNTC